jgi:hypothetical protein
MWGNKPGWFISVIIAAVFGWLIWSLGRPEGISAPSGEFNLTKEVRLPVAPEDALPGVMTDDRDAGDIYWQAIHLYLQNPKDYEVANYYTRRKSLPAVDLLLSATSAKRATIFLKQPDAIVNYKFPSPELDALMALGTIANSIAFSAQAKGDEETTSAYADASFALGAKLYRERLVHGELLGGINLMQSAGDTFKANANKRGDPAEQERWQRFGNQTKNYEMMEIEPLHNKIVSTSRDDIARYAGDVFQLAQHNPDRMWQVEAILKIGRYRFNATRMPDQVAAKRMLGDNPAQYGYPDFEKSDDPAVRTAGRAARELTQEQYRMMR